MIQFEKALRIILSYSKPLGTKKVRLSKISGYVLSKPVVAKYDSPLFDNSAVDGFGIKIDDVRDASSNSPAKLKLTHTVRAGDFANCSLKKGETVKILTGAKVPNSVEAVVMKEFCDEHNGFVSIKKSTARGDNIRKKGEEFKATSLVLPSNTLITPPVIGLLASLGYNSFEVYEKPKVALIVTGSELVKPGKKLKDGKIYESNSYAIAGALKEIGINKFTVVTIPDNKTITKKYISSALKKSDLIITVGGISVGDYDFVKEVLDDIGVKALFRSVAMKPAKPNYFGVLKLRNKNKIIFGLPGNPVSALISFHEFIKPFLLKMMGQKVVSPFNLQAMLTSDLKKKVGRLEFVRGILIQRNGNLLATPNKGQGSHMLSGIAKANCLIYFPKEKDFLHQGEKVTVELLKW